MRVLVLGGNGMFGSMIATVLAARSNYHVEQTIRAGVATHNGMADVETHRVDMMEIPAVWDVMARSKPDVVINCTGLIKQRTEASNPLQIFPINALFPHQLAHICDVLGVRVVHFSTDCIFSGDEGNYADDASHNATDYYGLSKWIGEIDYPNAITLRTSIIGHEADSDYQLVDWFLGQSGRVCGFQKAIFSGFPTAEIGLILADYVLPKPELTGVLNMSADPISKYDLLHLIKQTYGKDIAIDPEDTIKIDRSLNSDKFRSMTGYVPSSWHDLVQLMYDTRPNFKSN